MALCELSTHHSLNKLTRWVCAADPCNYGKANGKPSETSNCKPCISAQAATRNFVDLYKWQLYCFILKHKIFKYLFNSQKQSKRKWSWLCKLSSSLKSSFLPGFVFRSKLGAFTILYIQNPGWRKRIKLKTGHFSQFRCLAWSVSSFHIHITRQCYTSITSTSLSVDVGLRRSFFPLLLWSQGVYACLEWY